MPCRCALFLTLIACALPLQSAPENDALREELQRLRQRIDALEARLAASERATVDAKAAEKPDAEADADPDSEPATESTAAADATPQQSFKIGGALRFNYVWKDFDATTETKRGDIGLDIFRLNVDGQHGNFLLSAEYRFYSYMNTIHHGWVGYDFGSAGQVQAGITQVPFGLLPYAAHNFWFGLPYYIGLADDYDTGVKYILERGPWNLQLAAFKNGELGNAANLDRYSYDPVTVGTARNEQTNSLDARLAYTLGHGSDCSHELGGSGTWGQLYNVDTDDQGDYWAAALHLDSRCGRWNIQLEGGRYEYDPRNPAGVSDDMITFGAFGGTHEVSSAGNFGVVNVAYNLPVKWPGVDLLTCYNDFSVLDKDPAGHDNSYINTTGCAIGVGPTFTYIDIIRGRNAVFLGNGSLAGGGSDDWDTRLNVNLGYYW